MSKDKYIKESDLFKAMENNSHMVEVFGKQRKMIDGILLTYDIAEFERLNIEEIRAKAIDEFVEKLSLEISESIIWGMLVNCDKDKNFNETSDKIVDYVTETSKKTAEQMKAGGKNE